MDEATITTSPKTFDSNFVANGLSQKCLISPNHTQIEPQLHYMWAGFMGCWERHRLTDGTATDHDACAAGRMTSSSYSMSSGSPP